MLFNSFQYIVFLPIVFTIYWCSASKNRWIILLLSSYYFYMCWNAKYLVLILLITILSYGSAILIESERIFKKRKALLILLIIFCLAILFVFKYYNFFIDIIGKLILPLSVDLSHTYLDLLLPVGISFYTFQAIGYVIDVYNGTISAEHHFGYYAAYISFFPQLVAGPIERTSSLLPQLKEEHAFCEQRAISGVKKMLWGYYKKLVIADNLSLYVNRVYENLGDYTGFDLLIVVFFFSIQIYCDFSGYSDIAIGTARLLDIELVENFRGPYISSSIKEFWERWHISLSTWFKDYVYIPLGGNRCSKLREYYNLIVTFLISGLWHGANITFVVWGLVHGLAQVIEKNFSRHVLHSQICFKQSKIVICLKTILVFIFCCFAWVLFRANSISDASYVITHVFCQISKPLLYFHSKLMTPGELMLFVSYIAIVYVYDVLLFVPNKVIMKIKYSRNLQWCIYILIGLMIAFCSRKNIANEFVYFQF